MANVLVTEEFFFDTYRLVALLDGCIDDPSVEALRAKIESEIAIKLDARNRRQAFSDYKKAYPGSSKRENARRDYLDDAGIHPDWRSSKEIQP